MKRRVKYSRIYDYDRRKKLRYDGTAIIYIRAYLNGKNKYFPTGIYVSPSQWNKKNRQIINHSDQFDLNHEISELERALGSFETQVIKRTGYISLEKLVDYKQQDLDISFTEFYKLRLNESELSRQSYRDQNQTYDKLVAFRRDIQFCEIEEKLVRSFDTYLRKEKLHINTIAKHHKNLRKYINLAISERELEPGDNPYLRFKVKKKATDPLFLLPHELRKLENFVLDEDDNARKVLDFYLFLCWTGARYGDASKLTTANFSETDDGLELFYEAEKTGKLQRLKLRELFEGKPERLIRDYLERYDEFYFDDPDNPMPIFFGFSNPYVNRELKSTVKNLEVRERVKNEIHCHSEPLKNLL